MADNKPIYVPEDVAKNAVKHTYTPMVKWLMGQKSEALRFDSATDNDGSFRRYDVSKTIYTKNRGDAVTVEYELIITVKGVKK